MIPLDPDEFRRELDAAIRQRDARLSVFAAQVRAYHTSAFKSAAGSKAMDEDNPENHHFEYVSGTLPRLANNPPRLRTTSRRGGNHRAVAKATRYALHSWMDWKDVHPTLIEAATDFIFNFSAFSVCQEPGDPVRVNGMTLQTALPTVKRIPQRRFLMDPAALNPQEAAWTGMLWLCGHDALVARAERETEYDADCGWKLDVIRRLSDEQTAKNLHDRRSKPETQDLERHEVVLYDIWIREFEGSEDDPRYNGGIVTYAVVGNDPQDGPELVQVKEPRPYFGPAGGPFLVGGAFYVPDDPFPMGPLTATEPQVRELNNTAKAVSRNIREYKKLVLVESTADLDASDINKPDQFIIPVPGLQRDQVVQIELGGITEQQLVQLNLLRDRLARGSGRDDSLRGAVTGQGTATEHQIAAASADTRDSYIQMRWQQHVINMLKAAAWYLHNDERSLMPLGEAAAIEFGTDEPWFSGFGEDNNPEDYRAEDVRITIEAGSMRQINDAIEQRRVLQAVETMQLVANLYMVTMGQIDGPGIAAKIGDALNMPDFDELIDFEGLDQMMQIQSEAQANQQGAPQEGGTGRTGQPQATVNERNADRRAATAAA